MDDPEFFQNFEGQVFEDVEAQNGEVQHFFRFEVIFRKSHLKSNTLY